jgi:hypothetical protein
MVCTRQQNSLVTRTSIYRRTRPAVKHCRTKKRKQEHEPVSCVPIKCPKKVETFVVVRNTKKSVHWQPFSDEQFDDASAEFKKNKRFNERNGLYQYICGKPLNNGKTCMNFQCCKLGLYSGCRRHYQWDDDILPFSQSNIDSDY